MQLVPRITSARLASSTVAIRSVWNRKVAGRLRSARGRSDAAALPGGTAPTAIRVCASTLRVQVKVEVEKVAF